MSESGMGLNVVQGAIGLPDPDHDRPSDSIDHSIRLARDSESAMGELMQQCRDYLLLVANKELDSKIRAKVAPSDLVQDTLMLACDRFGQFRGTTESELLAWLRRILLNQLSDARKQFQRKRRDVNQEIPLHGGAAERGTMDPPANDLTPGARLASAEQTRLVIETLERLPEDYRRVIRMRNFERLPFAEIGRQLGKSEDAARKLWGRAIEKLQDELGSAS